MPTEALTPEIRRGGEVSERRFDPRSAAPFAYKSTRSAFVYAVVGGAANKIVNICCNPFFTSWILPVR